MATEKEVKTLADEVADLRKKVDEKRRAEAEASAEANLAVKKSRLESEKARLQSQLAGGAPSAGLTATHQSSVGVQAGPASAAARTEAAAEVESE